MREKIFYAKLTNALMMIRHATTIRIAERSATYPSVIVQVKISSGVPKCYLDWPGCLCTIKVGWQWHLYQFRKGCKVILFPLHV